MRASSVVLTGILLLLVGLGFADYSFVERAHRNAHPATETNLDLMTIARKAGFDFLPVSGSEQSFLATLLPKERKHLLRSVVLLTGGERLAAAHWYRSVSQASHLEAVKSSMYGLFSKDMRRLVDDTVTQEGFAPIEVLAFTDPALGEERFLFAHIRDHLYEFHFHEKNEGLVQGILQELARENF